MLVLELRKRIAFHKSTNMEQIKKKHARTYTASSIHLYIQAECGRKLYRREMYTGLKFEDDTPPSHAAMH